MYFFGVLFAIFVGIGFFLQHQHFEIENRAELERYILNKQDYIVRDLEASINKNIAVIESLEVLIHTVENPTNIEAYLQEMLSKASDYSSLYFGTTENLMINGSGWVPPADFDLRVRPWYIQAVNNNRVISTQPYLNASKTAWTVTFAKAVYDGDSNLIGVVAGDHSLKDMIEVLRRHYVSEHGFVFLLDEDNNVIMHSTMENMDAVLANEEKILAQLELPLTTQDQGMKTISVTDREGYVVWNTIESTGWVIGNFTPVEDFFDFKGQTQAIAVIMLMITGTLFAFLVYTQRHYILSPLMALSKEI